MAQAAYNIGPLDRIVSYSFNRGGKLDFYFNSFMQVSEVEGTWEGHTPSEIASDPFLLLGFEVFLGVSPGTLEGLAALVGISLVQFIELILTTPVNHTAIWGGEIGKDRITVVFSAPAIGFNGTNDVFSAKTINDGVKHMLFRAQKKEGEEDTPNQHFYLADYDRKVERLKGGELDIFGSQLAGLGGQALQAMVGSWGVQFFNSTTFEHKLADPTRDSVIPHPGGSFSLPRLLVATKDNLFSILFYSPLGGVSGFEFILTVWSLADNAYVIHLTDVFSDINRAFANYVVTYHDVVAFRVQMDEETSAILGMDVMSAKFGFLVTLPMAFVTNNVFVQTPLPISNSTGAYLLYPDEFDIGLDNTDYNYAIFKAEGAVAGDTLSGYSVSKVSFSLPSSHGSVLLNNPLGICTKTKAYWFFQHVNLSDTKLSVVDEQGTVVLLEAGRPAPLHPTLRLVGATHNHAYLFELAANGIVDDVLQQRLDVFREDGLLIRTGTLPEGMLFWSGPHSTANIVYVYTISTFSGGGTMYLFGTDGSFMNVSSYIPPGITDVAWGFRPYVTQDSVYMLGGGKLDGQSVVFHVSNLKPQEEGPDAPDVMMYNVPGVADVGIFQPIALQDSSILRFQQFEAWSNL